MSPNRATRTGSSFDEAPHSALEKTIEELVERAQRVLATQARLRSLLRANRAIVEQLDLEQVLRTIAEAALDLVDASYGALGVIAPDGTLEQFIHVGMSEEQAATIGHLPEGHGLLGAVIDSAAPIRLEHLGADPRSTGFPRHHPAMDTFLGVPIRVRDEIFGNLYLTNRADGPFSQEDEELVTALAATAGIAIENARLFDEAQRRQRWSAALAEVTSALLSGESDDVLGVVADGVATAVGAHLVCVIVPVPDSADMVVEVARGTDAETVRGRVLAREGTIAGRVLEEGVVVSREAPLADDPESTKLDVGPTVALPLNAFGRTLGVLTISRPANGVRFTDTDLSMAADFAAQASVAIELASARADRAQLDLVEDRSRIARDLHDHVIQRLFASGLSLQSTALLAPEPLRAAIGEQVGMIDTAIADIRTAVFTLTSQPTTTSTRLRHRVLDAVGELSEDEENTPRLTFAGPVDLLVTDGIADDVMAVVREGLSNAVRHSGASQIEIDVSTDGSSVTVTVTDDGRGMDPKKDRSSGTANLAERARRRAGTFALTTPTGGGTALNWSVPLEKEVAK
jgi:signal transduction histidine kinase